MKMKRYVFYAYNIYNGQTWDTKSFTVAASNKEEALHEAERIFHIVNGREDDIYYPYVGILKSSFRVFHGTTESDGYFHLN